MLYEVKIYGRNGKLKKVISAKQVQKNADQQWIDGDTPKKRAQRFRNKRFKVPKKN